MRKAAAGALALALVASAAAAQEGDNPQGRRHGRGQPAAEQDAPRDRGRSEAVRPRGERGSERAQEARRWRSGEPQDWGDAPPPSRRTRTAPTTVAPSAPPTIVQPSERRVEREDRRRDRPRSDPSEDARRHEDGRTWDGRSWDGRSWDDRRRTDRHDWNNDGRRDHRTDTWDRRRPSFDRHRYPWAWRHQHRYRGWAWYPPPGFYVRTWVFGDIMPRAWWGPEYRIIDWWAYGLPPPPIGFEWVRVGDDALLVDMFSGRVVQIALDLFW